MRHAARMLAAVLTLMLLLAGVESRAESVKAYISSTTMKVYESCSTSSRALGTMSFGESVACTGVLSGWARVENGGQVGYCDAGSLTATNPNRYSVTAYARDGARVYAKPNTDAASARLSENTAVTVVAVTGDEKWCRVTASGEYGYMKTSALAASPAESPVTAYVRDLAVAVYAKASTSADMCVLGYGEKLTCVAVSGGWAKVKSGGNTGYCDAGALTADNPNTLNVTVYPQSSNVRVYALPGTSASVLASVGTGTSMTAVALTDDGKWLRVKRSGAYGYVLANDVDTEKASSGTSSKVSQVIKLAGEQLGDPYVHATRGPDTFDCSGLTYYCFQQVAGITLSRSAQGQGYDSSLEKIENASDLKKGDIVCFDTEPEDSDLSDHVGIYLGDGRFIHCSSAAGKVLISSMSSGFYKDCFSWGRRVLK